MKQFTLETITSNRNYLFWSLQIAGWSGVAVITYLTFTVWNAEAGLSHIGHILFQSLQGALFTWPLRWIFTAMWRLPALLRLGLGLILVALLAALWTDTRIMTFMWMSGEEGVMAEFSSWYFGGFFIMACWAALYHSFKYYRLVQEEHDLALAATANALEQNYQRLRAEAVATDAQLKMLRYQLNPHFLFNTLNAIYSLSKLNEAKASQNMVQQLSRFMRYSLANDLVQPVTLRQEIEAVTLYLDIEKTRFAERLDVQIDIPQQAELALVPSLLLQPLVENAIKYAIAPSESGGTIGIGARVSANTLTLEIWDSGPGIDPDSNELIQGCGIGLRNTMERLKAAFGSNACVELGNGEAGGMVVKLTLPYQTGKAAAEDQSVYKTQVDK